MLRLGRPLGRPRGAAGPLGRVCRFRARGRPLRPRLACRRQVRRPRAAIVGEDLFVYRTAGPSLCFAHGRFRPEGVNGYELCSGSPGPDPFAMRLPFGESK
jgi:hypothetical protein